MGIFGQLNALDLIACLCSHVYSWWFYIAYIFSASKLFLAHLIELNVLVW